MLKTEPPKQVIHMGQFFILAGVAPNLADGNLKLLPARLFSLARRTFGVPKSFVVYSLYKTHVLCPFLDNEGQVLCKVLM